MNTKYTFKVNSLRTLTSPYKKAGEKDTESIYYLLVDMRDLPEGMPLDVNPREPKMTTNVARRIANAVIEPETDFYINNRGIVIAAKKAVFDSAKSEVTIDLGDQENDNDKYSYGILDGGHTYTAIMNNRDKIPADLTKYVRVEVITNVQNITRLSDARNTSAQVSDIALFNLDDNFLFVQEAISGQPYENKIAYNDNDNKEDRNEVLFNSVNENSDWISLRYLINIETGKNLPSIEMLIKLSIALEVDPVELFDDIYKILYNKE